jgi:hypothetical protein
MFRITMSCEIQDAMVRPHFEKTVPRFWNAGSCCTYVSGNEFCSHVPVALYLAQGVIPFIEQRTPPVYSSVPYVRGLTLHLRPSVVLHVNTSSERATELHVSCIQALERCPAGLFD